MRPRVAGIAVFMALPLLDGDAVSAQLGAALPADASRYFTITVVDSRTGRGVPLVELETVNHIKHYTDSNGVVAFDEPGLMDQKVFFHVKSHGYEFPKDGFGYRGKALDVKPGGSATLKIDRVNIAERLYRITGAGIYRDSVIVGRPVPLRNPVLDGLVMGSDSVINAVYRGRVYWFWGDTNRPGYPLGNFHVPGATSLLPQDGGLDPDRGVDLDYFLNDKGFAKETARMAGDGPTWIGGLTVLPDATGRERLYASYVKIRNFLETYRRGLLVFDDEKEQFEQIAEFDLHAPAYPHDHPFKYRDGGIEHIYFANPYPDMRCRADAASYLRIADYEAYTCLKEGSRLDDPQFDRSPDGALRFSWKKNTPPLGSRDQAKLVRAGRLKLEECPLRLRDADTGEPVEAHRGSLAWNDYRRRWVMIFCQSNGSSSKLGEIWYAEAEAPLGPWIDARKIVTHDRYTFYNPKQHPMLAKDGGRIIFFEGTYTSTFSGNPEPTPRYDYNQIMYKLDLADPRLALPRASDTPSK